VVVGVIDCVTVGRAGDVENGVLVSITGAAIGSVVDAVGISGSILDTLEQPVATINRNNKNIRLMKIYVFRSIAVLATE